MKTTRHSLMAKGIIVLLSLLVLVFAYSYSWYMTTSDTVSASGISGKIEATGDFEYAVGFSTSQTGGAYKHTAFTNTENGNINLEALHPSDAPSTTVNLLYDYNPTDLTGNGVTLVRPAMNYGNWSINGASRNYSIAEENVQFISFDLIFRTEVEGMTINLDSGSYAKGATPVTEVCLPIRQAVIKITSTAFSLLTLLSELFVLLSLSTLIITSLQIRSLVLS